MRRNYRVAMVGACPFPIAQGSQVLIRQLSEAMAVRGHEVHLVVYHLGDETPLHPLLRLHRIPPVPGYRKMSSGPAWGKLALDLLLLPALLQVVIRHSIDVIHAHNYEGLVIGWLVGRLTGRPVVYHSHNVMAAELPTFFRSALAQRVAGWLARLLDQLLPHRADACIALSSGGAAFFQALGVPPERIYHIPPGIQFDYPEPFDTAAVRERYGLGQGPLVVYSGNLDQYQRLESLLRSFGQVQAKQESARLVIASHSPASQYSALVRRVGQISGIRFIHCRSFAEARDLLLAADVAVCPRIACFGFPIKLLNYMAAGKPVVVAQDSAKGIRHLENGYVVPNSEAALAGGVLHMLEEPELARRLGAAAQRTVGSHFGWDHAVRKVERLYEDLSLPAGERVPVGHGADPRAQA